MDPRDQTFMTIHNLNPDATILFASESILDILGYSPREVEGKSAFDYFHPEEVPFARSIHSRGILLDKAAVLHYARILCKSGQWVSCECCFTVVHNVLVASTSIYFKGAKSDRRARDAPQIRRIFSSSPRDPRYHMLEHLSPKFRMPPMEREPRAALILNRFSRKLSIMYATDAVAQILGLQPGELLDRPFYECIQPNCIDEAERCLESAKANESIAYLRFWYKDPRIDPNQPAEEEEEVDEMADEEHEMVDPDPQEEDVKDPNLRDSSMDIDEDSVSPTPIVLRDGGDGDDRGGLQRRAASRPPRQSPQTFELEAVVSCTSDGLVVVLRRARPPIPNPHPASIPSPFNFENGLFAAPWGMQPIEPYISPELLYTFRPPFLPQYMPLRECVKAAGGPPLDQLMRSIRDVAVFAWAVTGINGTLANFGHGRPRIGAQPFDGLPVWESDTRPTTYPPVEDLDDDMPKDPSTASMSAYTRSSNLYQSNPHGYRARHASLDENMYNGAMSPAFRPAAAPSSASPYQFGSSSSSSSSIHGGYEPFYTPNIHQDSRRPPLRPAFSYDALSEHARHQQQAWAPGSTSEAAAGSRRRCGFGEEVWGSSAFVGGSTSSSGEYAPRHGPQGLSSGGAGESSKGAGRRYFRQ
ncbi:hypothetical protein VTI74DRAFT_10307 [Chaetomium olivicolor]